MINFAYDIPLIILPFKYLYVPESDGYPPARSIPKYDPKNTLLNEKFAGAINSAPGILLITGATPITPFVNIEFIPEVFCGFCVFCPARYINLKSKVLSLILFALTPKDRSFVEYIHSSPDIAGQGSPSLVTLSTF